jgi:hypothetical protein
MHLLVNERSVNLQAANPYAADLLLMELAETLEALEPRRVSDAGDADDDLDQIYSHSSMIASRLCPQITIEQLFWEERDHDSATLRRLRIARTLLLRNLRRGPYIDTLLSKIEHTCEGSEDGAPVELAGTSIAGAVHLVGILVSVRQSRHYPPGDLSVRYLPSELDEPAEIEHYTSVDEVRSRRRRYWPHPKHNASMPTYGVKDTPMNLSEEEAAALLNEGIPIGRRVFGRSAEGTIYVFPSHRPNEYHGYPVDVRELRKRAAAIYSRLRSRGWCK